MTTTELVLFIGMAAQLIGLLVVLFKTTWGAASAHESGITSVRTELVEKITTQHANFSGVIVSIGDRIHQLELKAMESRAIMGETYMRRDNYYKAAEEFKRDVKEAHDDLKQEMHAGFDELKEQITAVSMTIEENRKQDRRS